MKKFVFPGAIVLGLAMLVFPGTALAYSTSIQSSTECRTSPNADWTVTWTVVAGDYPGITWQITSPSPSGYTPSGGQPATDDFTKTVSYPSGQLSATETVTVSWIEEASQTVDGGIQRPPLCDGATTTTEGPIETDPAPTDPAPTDPAPTDPAPTDPEPAETDPAPTDPEPAETDPAPTDPEPAETDPAPTDPEPAETDPAPTDPASTTGDTTTPTDNSEAGDPDDSTPDSVGPDSPADGGPTLPATGRDSVKDMLTAALLLFGFGGLTVSVARGRRSELMQS